MLAIIMVMSSLWAVRSSGAKYLTLFLRRKRSELTMAEQTAISWADATFNPWIGCTKVSPACDHCYAARDNERRGWVPGWGAGVARRRTKTWGEPVKWNKQAAVAGYRPRVFCASLADVFDNEVDDNWREDLWRLVRETPNLRWMILTCRPGTSGSRRRNLRPLGRRRR